MSYHKLSIHKHNHKSPFKLQEEVLEYLDAISSNNKIMAIQELSDLYGCLENEISKFGLTIEDLKIMSDTTKQVFEKGTRTNPDLITYLKSCHTSIKSYGLGFIQVKCGEDINYNFYHKDLTKFENFGAPHNHQRNFISEIIKGQIVETIYEVVPGTNFAFCGCGDASKSKLLAYTSSYIKTHKESELYLRLNIEYHSVEVPHGTVTKVVKFGSKIDAFVISDDTSNARNLPQNKQALWRMVQEVHDT